MLYNTMNALKVMNITKIMLHYSIHFYFKLAKKRIVNWPFT